MPDDLALSVVVPIFKGKGDAMSCMSYKGVKLLEHAMKIVEKVQVDEMQFGFMPGKGTIDAVFILRKLQEEYLDKEKLYNLSTSLTWRRHLTGSRERYWSGQ